jgi:hypothetical protein
VGVLLHVPLDAVNVWPTAGVPVTVGGAVLTGAACEAALPTPAINASASSDAATPARALFEYFTCACSLFEFGP